LAGVNDLFTLAEQVPVNERPSLFLSCGADDFLIQHNRNFDRHLGSIVFKHVYEEHPGVHNWEYWNLHIKSALAFLCLKLGIP
jgi:putative tributyrin esterase